MNFVYENIDAESYTKIKSTLTSGIANPLIECVDHCIEALKFTNSMGSLSSRYYKTKKLMLQCSSDSFNIIVHQIAKDLGLKPKDYLLEKGYPIDKNVDKDFFLGFDEAGK